MAKKYYWLKLKNDFFTQPKIKKLRRIAGGDTYTIIYLKLQLLSLKDAGRLYFEGIEENFAEELALTIDEDAENVRVTLSFLTAQGLLELCDDDTYQLTEVPTVIGSETDAAERMRNSRNKEKHQKLLEKRNNVQNSYADVHNCYTEIEKDIEKDIDIEKNKSKSKSKRESKHKYGEYSHVLLTDTELDKLNSELGADMTNICITYLDEYIEMKGYKAKSHYLAIKKWVVDAVNEKQRKRGYSSKQEEAESRNDWIMDIQYDEESGEFL